MSNKIIEGYSSAAEMGVRIVLLSRALCQTSAVCVVRFFVVLFVFFCIFFCLVL